MKWKVEFKDIGRNKRSFTEVIAGNDEAPNHNKVARVAKSTGGLLSRDVEAVSDPDSKEGIVIVGGFRTVGTFTYEPES